GVAVHHALDRPARCRFFLEDLRAAVVRLAAVDDDRERSLAREPDLTAEEALLDVPRRLLAVEVESGLADRDDGRLPSTRAEERPDLLPVPFRERRGVVRVQPEAGMDALVPGGDLERRAAASEVGADRDDGRDAAPARAGDDVVAVRVEVG